jgi:hypothetical protein
MQLKIGASANRFIAARLAEPYRVHPLADAF